MRLHAVVVAQQEQEIIFILQSGSFDSGGNRLYRNGFTGGDQIFVGAQLGESSGVIVKVFGGIKVGKLTLDHVKAFEKERKDAGITSDILSPKLLPDYTRKDM